MAVGGDKLAGRPKLELEQDIAALDRLDGLREFFAGVDPADAAVFADDATVFARYRSACQSALDTLKG